MSNEQKHSDPQNIGETKPKKRRRWPWFVLLGLLLLLVALRFSLRSNWVLDIVKNQIEIAVTDATGSEFTVDRIRGDLLSGVTAHDIRLDHDGPVARMDSLELDFRISALISRRVEISKLHIHGPEIFATQQTDSTWNFTALIPEDDETEPESEPSPLPVDIDLQSVRIFRGGVMVNAPYLLPDSTLSVRDLELDARAFIGRESMEATLSAFSAQIVEGRLPEPITVETRAGMRDDQITLDKLVVSTGRSLLESRGEYNLDTDKLEAGLDLDPLSAADLRAYLDDLPEFESAQLYFSASGDFSETTFGLEFRAPELANVNLTSSLQIEPELTLKNMELKLSDINPRAFSDDEALQALTAGDILLRINGFIPFETPEEAAADLRIELARSAYDHITLNSLTLNGKLDRGTLTVDATAILPNQRLELKAAASRIFEELPEWEMETVFTDINPGYFTQDPELDGRISGRFTASGTGLEPGDSPWKYALESTRIQIADYQVTRFRTSGELTSDKISAIADIRLDDNRLDLNAEVREWQEEQMGWKADGRVRNIDLNKLLFRDDFPTDINLDFSGEGRGFDPETMELVFDLNMHESRLVGETIDTLHARANIGGGVLRLEESRLESAIADGRISGRLSLQEYTDPENRLDFSIDLKNLNNFAEPAGIETLDITGRLDGNITPRNGTPVFTSNLSLESIVVDTLKVERVEGKVLAYLRDDPEIEFDLEVTRPEYDAISIEKFLVRARALVTDDTIRGDLETDIIREAEFGLYHRADFEYADESFTLNTHTLTLDEDNFRLDLTEPFSIGYADGAVRMDTLKMVSGDDAYLDFRLLLNAEEIDVFVSAGDVDIGTLQDLVMDERMVDGIFTGRISAFILQEEYVEADINARIENLRSNGFEFELAEAEIDIRDERLHSMFNLYRQGDAVISSEFDLPFMIGDPETFPDTFFEEPVAGYLRMEPQSLDGYRDALDELGFDAVSGIIDFDMTLGGVAGNPEISSILSLTDAGISGVSIDSLGFKADYDHDNGRMNMESRILSLGQTAAEITGTFPFFIDMRTFEIQELEGNEPITMQINTNAFDVAALNEFIDRDTARNLRGRLDADIAVNGTVSEPEPDGNIRFTNGQVYLVENNITLRNMGADVDIRPDQLRINRIQAESSGSFNLDGTVALENFMPTEFDIRARMRNFRVYNTRDIDMFVTLDNRLTGPMDAPELSGNVILERGHVYLDNFGEAEIEQVVLDDEEEQINYFDDLYENLAMEVNLSVNRRVFIRNRTRPELELELEGDLDIVKLRSEELEVFGAMGVSRGFANQLGRRFVLDEGQLMFSGPPENPEMNVRLKYELRRQDDITIWYVITGDLENPRFAYESDPEMELQDIISYTLFGRPFNELQGWQQGVSGGSGEGNVVADAALDLILDRIESLAADRFGVDVIEIDHTTGSGTSVKAGKYLTDRLFVAIVQELSSDRNSQVIIEYLIRRNLELIFTGSDNYRTGVDVLWRLDY